MFWGLDKKIDVHTKDKRIRKKISPGTKVSPVKASLSENLSHKERLHQQIPQLSVFQIQ